MAVYVYEHSVSVYMIHTVFCSERYVSINVFKILFSSKTVENQAVTLYDI